MLKRIIKLEKQQVAERKTYDCMPSDEKEQKNAATLVNTLVRANNALFSFTSNIINEKRNLAH